MPSKVKNMFDRIIFEQIQEIWRFEQTRCDEPDRKPPDLEALRAVIETAFLASLKKEEEIRKIMKKDNGVCP
jgi:hypothetical protein